MIFLENATNSKKQGNQKFHNKEFVEALKFYRMAIISVEKDFESKINKDERNCINNDEDIAIRNFLKIVWSNCAEANIKRGLFINALQCCDKALLFDPRHAKTIMRRIRALQGLKREADALNDCKKFLQLYPENIQAQNIFLKLKKFVKVQNKTLQGLSKDEIKWRAWQARRGDVTVNDINLKKYVDEVQTSDEAKTLKARTTNESIYDFDARSPHWNRAIISRGMGGNFDSFTWQQNIRSIELKILLPSQKNVTDISLDLSPSKIQVFLDGCEEPYFCHKFRNKIYVGGTSDDRGSTWTLEENRVIVVYLCKWQRRNVGNCKSAADTWWRTMFIDATEEGIGPQKPPKQYYRTK